MSRPLELVHLSPELFNMKMNNWIGVSLLCACVCDGDTVVMMQVWMKNVNDEAPVFEPRNPVVRIKKGAHRGFTVYNVQAFDPDCDRITFQPASSKFVASFYCH